MVFALTAFFALIGRVKDAYYSGCYLLFMVVATGVYLQVLVSDARQEMLKNISANDNSLFSGLSQTITLAAANALHLEWGWLVLGLAAFLAVMFFKSQDHLHPEGSGIGSIIAIVVATFLLYGHCFNGVATARDFRMWNVGDAPSSNATAADAKSTRKKNKDEGPSQLWRARLITDKFGDKTGKKTVATGYIEGTYDNSVLGGQKLYVRVLYSSGVIAFLLSEMYKGNDFDSIFTESYTVDIKTSLGERSLTGYLLKDSGVMLDKKSTGILMRHFRAQRPVKFYIAAKSEYDRSVYRFAVDDYSGYEQAMARVVKD